MSSADENDQANGEQNEMLQAGPEDGDDLAAKNEDSQSGSDELDEPQTAVRKKGRPAKVNATLKLQIVKLENEKRVLNSKIREKSNRINANNALLDELETKCRNLETENRDLILENRDLKDNKASLLAELCDSHTRLSELEQERDEIMEQLSLSNTSEVSMNYPPTAHGLIIFDAQTQAVARQIEYPHIQFDARSLDAKQLCELSPDDLCHYDLVIILCGSKDIRDGEKGMDVSKTISGAVADISTHCEVYLVTLPPSRSRGGSGSSSVYNFWLTRRFSPPNDKVNIVNIDYSGNKDDLLETDDMLTNRCINLMKESIVEELHMPAPKSNPQPGSTSDEHFQTKMFLEVDKDHIGRIIGKGGSTISKLTSDYKVSMSVGKWLEPTKEDREVFIEKAQAVLIAGRNDRAKACCDFVSQMLAVDPPSKKRKN